MSFRKIIGHCGVVVAIFGASLCFTWSANAFSLDTAGPLEKEIHSALSTAGARLVGEPCDAILNVENARGVQRIHVGWSGECRSGLAHGDGELTLYFDGVPMFGAAFEEASGSAMHLGVPMSTLKAEDLAILQSACLEAGWRLGNVGGGTFVEYPHWARPNYWTFTQDGVIADAAADCGDRHYAVRVMMQDGETTGVIRGDNHTTISRTLRPGNLNGTLYTHTDVWNKGVANYNSQRERIASEREAERLQVAQAEAARLREAAERRYKDTDTPINNLADFLMGLGKVKAIQELSKGRLIVISSSDVSFSSGRVVVQFSSSPTSASEAVDNLNKNFSWSSWFDVTLGNNPISQAIRISCYFEPEQLDSLNLDGDFVAHARLEQLGSGSIALECTAP